MHKHESNRVEFYSIENMAGGYLLSHGEHILRNDTKPVYEDINDVLELYSIKKYLDHELYLKNWSQEDILVFKQKVLKYGEIVGRFMSKIDNTNVLYYYDNLLYGYIHSFWEVVSNQQIYKHISDENIENILKNYPHQIRNILIHKNLVDHYHQVIRTFLIAYPSSAEIILSIYEVKDDQTNKRQSHLPKSLTIHDKEIIISKYIESEACNLNYLRLIQNARNRDTFKLSDKVKLKAKRKEDIETKKMFEDDGNVYSQQYGVSITFTENQDKIKILEVKEFTDYYSYSLSYVKEYNDLHLLFQNFIVLFEYLDIQFRIDLVSKINEMDVLERVLGIHAEGDYLHGHEFRRDEMTSHAQIVAYSNILNGMGVPLESVLENVFMSVFPGKYNFAKNCRLSMPSTFVSYFDKVRLLAPEFESILKQYKLFVEDGVIDFELLQMSSVPITIRDIPSLNQNKYIYLNDQNTDIANCTYLLFSDQVLLSYVDPYKEKHYHTFFDLMANVEVSFNNYEDHQKPQINYLISKGIIYLDKNNNIQFVNTAKVLILKDLYYNEAASFHHYSKPFQEEAMQMSLENIVFFENSLLSRSEQCYFNYYLNKSEFTDGLDLRNRYLHGTQANPEETQKHENAYFIYLKLLVLILLKIENDLLIFNRINRKKGSG